MQQKRLSEGSSLIMNIPSKANFQKNVKKKTCFKERLLVTLSKRMNMVLTFNSVSVLYCICCDTSKEMKIGKSRRSFSWEEAVRINLIQSPWWGECRVEHWDNEIHRRGQKLCERETRSRATDPSPGSSSLWMRLTQWVKWEQRK